MTDLADKFFSAFVHEADPESIIDYRNAADIFVHTPSDQEAWKNLYGFVMQYNKFPKDEAYEDVVQRELQESEEPAKYYYDKLINVHIRKSMLRMNADVNTFLKENKELSALKVVEEMVKATRVKDSALQLFDFKDSHDILKQELRNKNSPDYGVNLGWKTLDDMTGGFRGGDMVSIVGRPGQGKSFLALAAAMHAWKTQKKPVFFVSMEMNPVLVFERMAAMYQGIPYNWVKNGQFSTFQVDQKAKFLGKMEKLRDSSRPPFHVIGGNFSANVEDIAEFTKQLEPGLVVVDGAYLCKTTQNVRKSNERISFVCEYLKQEIAEKENIPVIPVWQFNREAAKLKKDQRVGLEHIADSDAIPRTSSVILGLFQEENAGTVRQRKVQILKGRSGEQGEFNINWNFRTMQFDEIEPIDDNDQLFT